MSSFDAARCLQYGLIRFGFICNQKTSNMITGSSDLRKLWNTWPNFNRITRITDYLIISQSHSHSAAATLSISSFHFASLGRFRTLRLGWSLCLLLSWPLRVCCLCPKPPSSQAPRDTQRHPETPRETTDSEQHRMTNCMMNQLAHTYTHTHWHITHRDAGRCMGYMRCNSSGPVWEFCVVRLCTVKSTCFDCWLNMFRTFFLFFFLMVSRFFSFFCVEVYGWTHSIFHHGPLGFQQRWTRRNTRPVHVPGIHVREFAGVWIPVAGGKRK